MSGVSSIDLAVIAVYLLAVLGVGLYQALKIRTTGDYYAGGRKFNKFYLMMHALGTASHADEPVSVIGGAYEKGLSGIWYTYLYLPLTPIFWLLAPYIRRSRFVTSADFFRARYDGSLAILYAIVGVLKMSVAIGVGLKGTATIVDSISGGAIDQRWAIFAMTAVFVAYGVAGGLRATVVTESIQGPLIVLMSLLLLPFALHAVGGFAGLHRATPPDLVSLTAPGLEFTPQWIAVASVTALVGFVAQPGILAAFASGKTELEGRIGYTYGTMIKRFCAIGWVFTGVALVGLVAKGHVAPATAAKLHKNRELAFGAAMQALLPHGMLGLMFAAVFATQMATLSSQMVNASALASRNLYHNVFRPRASDREVLWVGRLLGLFLVAIGVYLALALGRVANALTMLLQFSAIMGVVVWAGVLWRRANVAGAWTAVAILLFVWGFFGPIGMLVKQSADGPAPYDAKPPREEPMRLPQRERMPTIMGIYGREKYLAEVMIVSGPPAVAGLIIVSLLTRPQPKKQLDDFFLLLRTPVGQEQRLIDAGVPIVYAGSTKPNWLEEHHPKLVHWGGFMVAVVICILILGLLKLLAGIGS